MMARMGHPAVISSTWILQNIHVPSLKGLGFLLSCVPSVEATPIRANAARLGDPGVTLG